MTAAKKRPYFTPAIDKHFAEWILKDTWYKNHPYDVARFHRFVLAVHKFSKLVRGKVPLYKWRRDEHGNFVENGYRNPRTCNNSLFKTNIIEAVKRNHHFNHKELEKHASLFADKAIDILDFLWDTRDGLRNLCDWSPPLK